MKKILAVDNDLLILDFLRDLLEEAGHLVETAEDGISALETLKTFTPDIIFVDLIMPNIDGKKLCRIMHKMEKLKDTCIVILSAAAKEDSFDVSELGVDGVIAKGPLEAMAGDIFAVVKQAEVGDHLFPPEEVSVTGRTHQRGITKELLSTKRHFELVLERMTEGILEITPDGKIVYANRAACTLTGLPEENLLGFDFPHLFSQNDHQWIREQLQEGHKEGKEYSRTKALFLRGYQVTMDFFGIPEEAGKCIVILNNATDQIKAEIALKKSRERFRLAAESSADLIYEWDMESDRLEWFGDIDGSLGFKSENFPRTLEAWVKQIHPDDQARLIHSINQRRISGDRMHEEYRILRQDGSWRYWIDRAMPVSNSQGYPSKWVGACEDITERKRLEGSIIQSERLAATGQLAASIAHQINSPLQGVTALLNVMKSNEADSKDMVENINLLEGAFDSIRNTVRKLLDLNRPGHEEKQKIDIHEIIKDTMALLRTHLRQNGIRSHLNLCTESIYLTASPQQLEHVFLNLINNAMEAIDAETVIDNRKETGLPVGEIWINTNTKEGFLVIEISDSGPGIPEDALHCVFDAFYTRKGKLGMGIGLSVCNRIIEEHKGTIGVRNTPGSGATFRISLPLTS